MDKWSCARRWLTRCKLKGDMRPEPLMDAMEPVFCAEGYRADGDIAGQERILLVELSPMGDNILHTPFYRELRRTYPQAFIALLSKPYVAQMTELCPYVNRVIPVDIDMAAPPEENAAQLIRLSSDTLWDMHFTMAICLQWSGKKRSNHLLAYLCGAQQRIAISDASIQNYLTEGVVEEQWECLLTHPVVTPKALTHEVERSLYPLVDLGFDVRDDRIELWYDLHDAFVARRLLHDVPQDAVGIALGVGARKPNRKYPIEKYIAALQQLLQQGNYVFVVLGGADERADGERIAQQLPAGTVWNFAGETTLRVSFAILAQLDAYLGNDTGLAHAAAALGLSVAVVSHEAADRTPFLPGVCSETIRFAPWQAKKAVIVQPEHALDGCRDALAYGGCQKPYAHCIKEIPPEVLVRAVHCLLEATDG